MDCEKRRKLQKKKNASETISSSDGIYSKKVKCSFRLRSIPSGSDWKVVVRCGMHNHRVENDLEGHNILGRLKGHEREFVNDVTKYHMAPRYIIAALKDKDLENLTTIIQVYKARSTYRVGKRGTLTELQILLSLLHKYKYMCWTRNRDNSNIVADIFWTHPDSVKLLHMFHLVLIFDCTYKTNRYRIPVLEIVGQRVLKKKVRDLTYPSTTSMCPPPVKYKSKRGVKKSRKGQESDVHPDPSQWEHVEAS
ncbi:protein FAR1-RELATED SEQUENCE 5-like [Vicia villosa]|uniref:protein FAR1-RELATED SEQUENCE 5-like n=1 Tax=Vicia villosa TaxID=3911 RepID=UPI00273B627E|nr:protein FAR1-RELATED SEQUENCE 5-like [Vicia villosa]